MKRLLPTCQGLSLLLLAGLCPVMAVQADETIKPGLWEVSVKADVNGQQLPDMQEMLEKVPPEMREQVKAMMAKNGNNITDNGAVRICLTAEQIANNEYGADPNSRCKTTDVQKQGNKTTMKLVCDKPKGEGVTEMTILSDTAWQSMTRMTIDEQGEQQQISSDSSAQWVSADCGSVQRQQEKSRKEK